MNSVFFGISGLNYSAGVKPSCAINNNNVVVAIHTSSSILNNKLYARVGSVIGTELALPSDNEATIGLEGQSGDSGVTPAVALNDNELVVEVHDSGSGALWYWLGTVSGVTIDWVGHGAVSASGGSTPVAGRNPALAFVGSQNSTVILVYENAGTLNYATGTIANNTITWTTTGSWTGVSGNNPSVAVFPTDRSNRQFAVVAYEQTGAKLSYLIINMTQPATVLGQSNYDQGLNPSIAATPDGYLIEVHQSQNLNYLYQRIGQLTVNPIATSASITWLDWFGQNQYSYLFDSGIVPSVSFGAGMAIHVHQSENATQLYGSASWWVNRAGWMSANIATLGNLQLTQLVMPASHDAGMYPGSGFSILGKTQDLSFYGQLCAGVRYFDCRPEYFSSNQSFVLNHNGIHGAPLANVLADVKKFLSTYPEFVILKFSHYNSLDQTAFNQLCVQIYNGLGSCLAAPPPKGGRMANLTLSTFTTSGTVGAALVVCDGAYSGSETAPTGSFLVPNSIAVQQGGQPINLQPYIKCYRDWSATDPQNGDLTVFDVYSNSGSLQTMEYGTDPDGDEPTLPVGQFPKFDDFNGTCKNTYTPVGATSPVTVPCDLFLLSWTLTPPTAVLGQNVWAFSSSANKVLGSDTANIGANSAGQIVNLLYVDYVEYARVCDVALARNGITPSQPANSVP